MATFGTSVPHRRPPVLFVRSLDVRTGQCLQTGARPLHVQNLSLAIGNIEESVAMTSLLSLDKTTRTVS